MQSLVSSSVTTGSGAGGSHEAASICHPGSGGQRGERVAWGKAPCGGPSPAAGTGGAEHLPSAPPARAGEDRRAAGGSASRAGAGDGRSPGSAGWQRQGGRDAPIPIPIRSRSLALPPPPGTRRRGSPEPLPGNASSPRSSSCFCRAWLAQSHRLKPGRTPARSRRGPRCQHAGGESSASSILHGRQPGTAEGEEGARQVGLSGGLEL